MAEDSVVEQEINGDEDLGHKLNGVETKEKNVKQKNEVENDNVTDMPREDDNPDSPLILRYEDNNSPFDKSESIESNTNDNIDNDKTDNDSSTLNLKREAPFDDQNDFLGFETEPEDDIHEIYLTIEKLEREIADDPDQSGPMKSIGHVNKRQRISSPALNIPPDVPISRPSSGMSIQSENEVGMNANEHMSPGATGLRASIGRKGGIDLSNPIYRAPMELGWKRELVYRANLDQNLRRQADVYYYSPSGKKLRSTREVSEHLLGTDLTVENFTFFKESLGIDDPEKEVIRGAKVIKNRTDSPLPGVERLENEIPAITSPDGKRVPKPKGPKGSSPDRLFNITGKSKPLKVKSVGSRLSLSSPGPNAGTPPKTPPIAEAGKSPNKSLLRKSVDSQWKKPTQEMEDSMDRLMPTFNIAEKLITPVPAMEKVYFGHNPESVQPQQQPRSYPPPSSDYGRVQQPAPQPKYPSPPHVSSQMTNQMDGGGRDMCPMRCPLANKETPTLQCSLCLCLYHSLCTGFLPNSNTSYVCKNCHLSNSSMPASSSPISHAPTMRTPPKGIPTASVSPILQRFPKPQPIMTRAPQPRLVPVVGQVPVRQKPFGQPPKIPKSDYSPFKSSSKFNKPFGNSPESKNKNYPGSLSPWPSLASGIQPADKLHDISRIKSEIDMSIFPQSIAILNGHKFIVVPKPNPINVLSPLSSHMMNPRQADNAPKIVETGISLTASASNIPSMKMPIKLTDDLKDDNKLQFKMLPKSDAFNNTSIISFDNLSMEYGKLLFKPENPVQGPDATGVKRALPIDEDSVGAKRKSKGQLTPKTVPKVIKRSENGTTGQKGGVRGAKGAEGKNKNYFAEFYKQNSERGYNSFVQIFQYLKMRELAAAARVCRMWREIADLPALWKSVRMKNSQVNDWEGLAAALKRHGTRHLDLRKMLHHHPPDTPDKAWDQFIEHISTVDTLVRIELCRCPAIVVEQVCERMPQLQALTAASVRCTSLNPAPLAALTNLQELRIKGMTGLNLTSDLKCLENLTKLKHLSITSVKELGKCGCVAIGNLVSLESLELGECTGDVGGVALLRNLTNLTRLRLERCPGASGGSVLLRGASGLPVLRQLELINFDIKPGFEDALGKCTNVKRLLIIPTYVSQSATTNRCVLAGVLRLKSSLTHLVWGVTMELLKVTELFIDQCDRNQPQSQAGVTPPGDGKTPSQPTPPKRGGVGDCIPVLKPVPGLSAEEVRMADMAGRPQVEILPLPALQRLLAAELPETRLKLLRIPYHHTWRQTFNDFD